MERSDSLLDSDRLGMFMVVFLSVIAGFALGVMCAERAIESVRQAGEVVKWTR